MARETSPNTAEGSIVKQHILVTVALTWTLVTYWDISKLPSIFLTLKGKKLKGYKES